MLGLAARAHGRMSGWTEWLVASGVAPSAMLVADADSPASLGQGTWGVGRRRVGMGVEGVERTLPFVLGTFSELWLISVVPSISSFF